MNRREDPYAQGIMISGIVAGWILLIAIFMQMDKPVVPKLLEKIGGIFGL